MRPFLRPCPFCRSTYLQAHAGYVQCNQCGTDGPYVPQYYEGEYLSSEARMVLGIDKWNSRAVPETQGVHEEVEA